MPGMYGHSPRLYDLATQAGDRVHDDVAVAVVMSVVAAEGFINELAEAASLSAQRGFGDEAACGRLADLSRLLRLAEEGCGDLLLKYQLAAQVLAGQTFPTGEKPFQDFSTLVKLRNQLVHFKPLDQFTEAEGSFPVPAGNTHPKLVQALQQKGLARKPEPNHIISWFDSLLTVKVADWA